MALDFQKVKQQIKELAQQVSRHRLLVDERLKRASDLLENYATDGDALRDKVTAALRLDAKLRTATPAAEPLDASFPPPPLPPALTLLAADGSQIYASKHAAVEYSLINVGVVQFSLGVLDDPTRTSTSELSYGLKSEELVSIDRDLRERQVLAEHAVNALKPVVALTDGPLELWGGEGQYAEKIQEYLHALAQLSQAGVAAAGYVDKPVGNYVVRLLEIASQPVEEAGREHPLLGVRDAYLFQDAIPPGYRSAVFGIQSFPASSYEGDLALHFFYLNVGREEKPWLARVEVPAWVANDVSLLNNVHAALLQQTAVMGIRPYPYILHRAHEEALVSFDEKRQLDLMIGNEVGVFGPGSYKQAAKDAPTQKTRFEL